MTFQQRPRVLLLAYQCNPRNASEPRVGYEWARHLQDQVELTVLTHERNLDAITADGQLRCRILYVPAERMSRSLQRLNAGVRRWVGSSCGLAIGLVEYLFYEMFVHRVLPASAIAKDFNLVHRVSPKRLWWPSLCVPRHLPFILGPVNSGMDWPASMRMEPARCLDDMASLASTCLLSAMLGRYVRRSSRLLVANPVCQNSLPSWIRRGSIVMPETAAETADWPQDHPPRKPGPLRLLFVGRLIPLKGIHLLLQALQACKDAGAVLTIVGEGPLDRQLRERIVEYGLSDRVQMAGQVDRVRLGHFYSQSDVFVFPSLRESGGNVVYEAMASGLPVIAVDHGGPAAVVGTDCGILVPPTSAEGIISGFASGIRQLAANESLRQRMGSMAARHVRTNHTWQTRVQSMLQLYQAVLSRQHPASFASP